MSVFNIIMSFIMFVMTFVVAPIVMNYFEIPAPGITFAVLGLTIGSFCIFATMME